MRAAFGDFVLDTATRQLLRAGEGLHLEPKAFELLCLLFERRPAAVSKAEIRDRLWPDTFVSDASLTGLATQIRQALDDSRTKPRFLRTVHRFGYAFCGDVPREAPAGRKRSARVIWDGRVIGLSPGENILGRDESAVVEVDLPGVSRRHARIVIEGARATLEDLGSKNGTYLREVRLDAPAVLADGDGFRLGRHLLMFRDAPGSASTRTEGSRGRSD